MMKLVTEYLSDAIKFDQMADDAKDSEVKTALKSQAQAYRKLAIKRAKELGMPPPDVAADS